MSRTGTRVSGKTKKKRSPWRKRLLTAFSIFFIFGSAVFIFGSFKFKQALEWAETKVQNLDSFKSQLATSPTTIVSADGKVLYRLQSEFRRSVEFEEIPELVKQATLAAEDKTFYQHSGVNWFAAARSAVLNTASGGKSPGASTITMQLAKRLYTSTEKSIDRKIKDMALAMQIERRKTKDQVLELYLNQVYYGAGAYGIAAAADVYFGKKLDQLSIAEAAMLAGLVQRPSKVNPFDNLDASIKRRNYVLRQMREENWITQADYEDATASTPKLAKRSFGSGERILAAPYYVRYVLDQLDKLAPEIKEELSKGGYKIYTTLNSEIQAIAEDQVRDVVRKYRRLKVTTGAFVLIDADGKILSMVGGVDFERNQYNIVYQGVRQPGSSFKPFVYSAAFSTGVLGPNDSISNKPILLEEGNHSRYWPKRSKSAPDIVSVRSAITSSQNPAAVHAIEMVTPAVAVSYAKDVFGIRSPLDPTLALALGSSGVSPLEMAEAYSVFMLQGDRAEPYGITRIEGPNGELIHEFKPKIRRGLLDSEVAAWMDDDLRGVVTGGTATFARVVPNARGKTGTTSDNRDAWFCGYTNNYVGIGWVGNEYKKGKGWAYDPMSGVFGGKVTVQIWTGVMKRVVDKFGDGEDRPNTKKRIPAGGVIEPAPVDPPIDDMAGTMNGGDNGTTTGNAGGTATPPIGDTVPPITDAAPPATDNKPPVTKPPTAGGGQEEQYVEAEICAESGALATMYCPETVTRKFKKGHGPRSRCRMHGPAEKH